MTQPLFDFLRGEWILSRSITDRRADQMGAFEGHAVFSGAGTDLDYVETGTLRLGEVELAANRAYRWSCTANGAVVSFQDGSPFHSFTRERPSAAHLCGEDQYWCDYEFGTNGWSVTWRVEGPRKDYTSVTHYTRP